ncbi:MAG: complex I NDUFA9 subunit family protein [Methylophilaceae bacterium]|nr:complex I NDUFA9 subunit family protein [Methylophilaceae bacterium]
MQIRKVVVLGGSGFVGGYVVAKLDAAGYQVKVLTRRRESAKHLILLPNVEVVECNVMQDAGLDQELTGSDAVINLVGILHNNKTFGFERIHHQLPRRVAQLCAELGIPRLIQMSALQASASAPSAYLRSKAAGEAAVLEYAKKLDITIFRPSVIFGRGDSFINLFAQLIKLLPVVMLAKPDAKFQPIWVEDVAICFVSSLQNIATYSKVYELGGPKVYSLRQLVQAVADELGKKRIIVGLNDSLSMMQGFALGLMPIKLMTTDNIKSMQVDNVCKQEFPTFFNLTPTALETIMPEYLNNQVPRAAYDKFRGVAGR